MIPLNKLLRGEIIATFVAITKAPIGNPIGGKSTFNKKDTSKKAYNYVVLTLLSLPIVIGYIIKNIDIRIISTS